MQEAARATHGPRAEKGKLRETVGDWLPDQARQSQQGEQHAIQMVLKNTDLQGGNPQNIQ